LNAGTSEKGRNGQEQRVRSQDKNKRSGGTRNGDKEEQETGTGPVSDEKKLEWVCLN